MITVVVRLKTQVEFVDEYGDEVNRSLYTVVDVAEVPGKGDQVFLPTPTGYGLQEFRVNFVYFVAGIVLLSGEVMNHYMDQEIYDDLLRIGYKIEKPSILIAAEESLFRDLKK